MSDADIKKEIDWVIMDLQRLTYVLEPENVKKSNILFDNVVSTVRRNVDQLNSIKSCLKTQEETKVTNTDVSNSIIKDTIEKLESIMPGMSHMPMNRSLIVSCINNLKTVQFYFDENIQSKKVEYVKTTINQKYADHACCIFLPDYYKKKAAFVEAIMEYGYKCEKRSELEKEEWFLKILGYHSELIDILMASLLKGGDCYDGGRTKSGS